MRISLIFSTPNEENILLPLHYNKTVQGMIYNLVKEDLPEVHDYGYYVGNRVYRLFVFSRLFSKEVKINKGEISMKPPIELNISSIMEEFIGSLSQAFFKVSRVKLGNNFLVPKTAKVLDEPDFNYGKFLFKALSPVTVYSTLNTGSGKKKTYYYHPREPEFGELLKENLMNKAKAMGILDVENRDFSLENIKVNNKDQKIIYYGDTVIKGWMGLYQIAADPLLLKLAYQTGVGSKNSQGFGMLGWVK